MLTTQSKQLKVGEAEVTLFYNNQSKELTVFFIIPEMENEINSIGTQEEIFDGVNLEIDGIWQGLGSSRSSNTHSYKISNVMNTTVLNLLYRKNLDQSDERDFMLEVTFP